MTTVRTLRCPLAFHWNCVFGCAGEACYCASAAVAPGGAAALSEGAGSSFTSGLIIWAITGWFCLSCMILVMAWMKALGASTKAFDNGNEHFSSIFLDQGWSSSIRSRIATALFSHRFRSHSSLARCASDPVCSGTIRAAEFPVPRGMHYRAMWQSGLDSMYFLFYTAL